MGSAQIPNLGRIGWGDGLARARLWAGFVQLSIFVLAACAAGSPVLPAPAPQATSSPPAFVVAPPATALPQLVAAERSAAGAKDLALLAQLWAPEARIVDGRGTDDPADDFVWEGRLAVLDRYVLAVFPNPPPPFAIPPALAPVVTGDTAAAELGQDRWRFVTRAGRWWLVELRY